MFSTIFVFLPFLFFIFQFYCEKKRKSVSWEIKKGQICYNCKESLNVSEEDIWDRLMKDKDYSKICISCNRDRKISLLKNPLLIWKYKFQKFIISDKFKKIHWIFLPLAFFFIILDLVLIFCGVRLKMWLVYGSINIIWWFIITWKIYYTTIKKPSE
jgi:hypothetical protein